MFLGEPPATPLDFDFKIFNIPVRVSGLFWVLPVIFGIQSGHPLFIIVWAIAVFVGVLVHEMGHALAYRRYGISPRIALTMFGGYATENYYDVWNLPGTAYRSHRTTSQNVTISAAGPAAGFLLAAAIVGVIFLAGGRVQFFFEMGILPLWNVELVAGQAFQLDYPVLMDHPSNRDLLVYLIHASLFVNIYWGIMNLMPVYPLDGGQIARELMVHYDRINGFRNSLWLSVATGALIAGVGFFVMHAFFLGFMFAIFAFQSWQMIQQMDGKGFGPGPW